MKQALVDTTRFLWQDEPAYECIRDSFVKFFSGDTSADTCPLCLCSTPRAKRHIFDRECVVTRGRSEEWMNDLLFVFKMARTLANQSSSNGSAAHHLIMSLDLCSIPIRAEKQSQKFLVLPFLVNMQLVAIRLSIISSCASGRAYLKALYRSKHPNFFGQSPDGVDLTELGVSYTLTSADSFDPAYSSSSDWENRINLESNRPVQKTGDKAKISRPKITWVEETPKASADTTVPASEMDIMEEEDLEAARAVAALVVLEHTPAKVSTSLKNFDDIAVAVARHISDENASFRKRQQLKLLAEKSKQKPAKKESPPRKQRKDKGKNPDKEPVVVMPVTDKEAPSRKLQQKPQKEVVVAKHDISDRASPKQPKSSQPDQTGVVAVVVSDREPSQQVPLAEKVPAEDIASSTKNTGRVAIQPQQTLKKKKSLVTIAAETPKKTKLQRSIAAEDYIQSRSSKRLRSQVQSKDEAAKETIERPNLKKATCRRKHKKRKFAEQGREEVYRVNRLKDALRDKSGRWWFEVSWVGYSSTSWEPENNLVAGLERDVARLKKKVLDRSRQLTPASSRHSSTARCVLALS